MEKKVERFSITCLILAPILLFSFSLMALSFPIGVYTVFFTNLSSSISFSNVIRGLYLFVGPFPLIVPVQMTVGLLFIIFLSIYIVMFVILTLKNISIWKSVKLSLRGGIEHLFESNINAMMLYTGALVFVSGVMDRIQELFGVQTGSLPSSDPLETFLGLTVAPLREEIGFRMLLIGSVTFLLSLPNVKEAIASLWKPCLSENSKRHPLLLASSIAISSFLFGLSHFTSGSGWQIGKVSEATYAGILLGYAYYKYGFHVAVMMHWTVDYFGSVYSFFGQGFAGIPWDSQNGYILSNAVALDLLILLGIAGTVVLAFRFFTKVIKFSAKEKMEPFL